MDYITIEERVWNYTRPLRESNAQKDEEIARKDKEIARKDKEIAQRNKEIAQQEAMNAEQNEENAQLLQYTTNAEVKAVARLILSGIVKSDDDRIRLLYTEEFFQLLMSELEAARSAQQKRHSEHIATAHRPRVQGRPVYSYDYRIKDVTKTESFDLPPFSIIVIPP